MSLDRPKLSNVLSIECRFTDGNDLLHALSVRYHLDGPECFSRARPVPPGWCWLGAQPADTRDAGCGLCCVTETGPHPALQGPEPSCMAQLGEPPPPTANASDATLRCTPARTPSAPDMLSATLPRSLRPHFQQIPLSTPALTTVMQPYLGSYGKRRSVDREWVGSGGSSRAGAGNWCDSAGEESSEEERCGLGGAGRTGRGGAVWPEVVRARGPNGVPQAGRRQPSARGRRRCGRVSSG